MAESAGEEVFQKPISNPDFISILVPTRARPEMFRRMLESLQAHTAKPELLDVWAYVDDDDAIMHQARAASQFAGLPFQVHFYTGVPGLSQGGMVNKLWRVCASNAGIYMCGVDDHLFITPGWDEQVRAAFNKYPDRIALAYPVDQSARPEDVTIIILSAEWVNLTGRFMTEYFQAWFDDTWMDEVSQFVQRKIAVPAVLQQEGQRGVARRLRNYPFWLGFYICMREVRLLEALKLLAAIHGENTEAYRQAVQQAQALADRQPMQFPSLFDVWTPELELKIAGRSRPEAFADIPVSYWDVELAACRLLLKKMDLRLAKGYDRGVTNLIETLLHALYFRRHPWRMAKEYLRPFIRQGKFAATLANLARLAGLLLRLTVVGLRHKLKLRKKLHKLLGKEGSQKKEG
jgi:hypothetical protein